MNTAAQGPEIGWLARMSSIGIIFLRRVGRFLDRQRHRIAKARSARKRLYQMKWQERWSPERPLVTVIVPCFNYGRYVEGAIQSVLAQTFQRFEIIVIDDGSTDSLTQNVLDKLAHEKTRVLRQSNQGLAETRNNGARVASGKYICYLDADDILEPEYLERTLFILESDEGIGCCYSWVQCFGTHNSVWQTEDFDPFFLRQYTTAPSHSVIRKEAWDRVVELNGAGFLSKYNGYFEDWVFWIDMVQCGYRGCAIPEALIRYRVHDESLGARHRSKFNDMLKVLHTDRRRFFHDRAYARELANAMNREIRIVNNLVNLAGTVESEGLPG